MNIREHSRLAAELISACGGLDEIDRNFTGEDRLRSKSVMSGYQNPHDASTMPAEIIARLERYCGKAIYSGALLDAVGAEVSAGNLQALACQLTELVADLQRRVRQALADDRLTPREMDSLAAAEREAEAALEQLKGARRAAEAAGPHLKAVQT